MLKKQEILLGKGTRAESSRVREPRRTALSHGFAVSGFMVMVLVSELSLANHSDSDPSWWCMPCSAKMDAREKDSGRWSDMWCLLLTFPKLCWLMEAVFLTRTSCCKTTHANGCYGAWPGWVVSINVLPLTVEPSIVVSPLFHDGL